ncbi:Rrf2 family transcriptional regulator [Streptomyces sudanensis]|uniref:RrF2 family transcriptional regulator n=1 Tax=Streptomyces sudanensis TaxID=436397 RepID=UPI0020CCA3DA|nr:Rrf2 family transcriptional regulator [Streptomyces sudanensis]MCP9989003.1 Rrf2 family transcriptional regulator [Streptomyces sudanensis]
MRLTKFTDLALRAVMWLAVFEGDEAPTTREVAEAVGVPAAHLAKAVTRLRHLGVLEARRGRGGGLALTALGRGASIGWLVRELEGPGEVAACEDGTPCPLRAACRLRSALREAQEAFHASLDPLTVADLVSRPTGPVLVALTGRRPGRPAPAPRAEPEPTPPLSL